MTDTRRTIDKRTKKHIDENDSANEIRVEITNPNCNDVLGGRGKASNAWKGNIFFRELVNQYKIKYILSNRTEKINITMRVYDDIQGLSPRGRFLDYNSITNTWYEASNERAIRRVRQTLREGGSELKEQLTPACFDNKRSSKIIFEEDLIEFLQMVSLNLIEVIVADQI